MRCHRKDTEMCSGDQEGKGASDCMREANWEIFKGEVGFDMGHKESVGFTHRKLRGSPFPERIREQEKFGKADI